MSPSLLLKYKAPVISASPSLSTKTSALFAPRYLSSKLSYVVAADVAELAEAVALLADAVALLAAAVALEAAAVADAAADTASTSKAQ